MRLIAYIDDILVLAESREELESHIVALIYLLECMGYIINWKKSITNPARSDGGYSVHGTETPIGQVEKDSCGVMQTRKGTDYLCPLLGAPPGEDECNNCHFFSSSILQTPADDSHPDIGRGTSILRNTGHPFPRGERGTDVVGHPHVETEWEITSKDGD